MGLEVFIQHFEELFDETDKGTITKDTHFRELDEWSSLIALSLIAMVDEKYEKKISGEHIKTSNTVEDLFNKIN